ncbi:hypothetical protein H5410_038273 [Solanum commersonii]|uniref:Xylanase inhibitor C-terminal domain-containing protein n=1 Tax=Solanum commersonii TaxID=4109 RepID=A0A9J5Y9L5_SOLCO|nr:hypothetical protein H5410_038273 [Solanum commersonii]
MTPGNLASEVFTFQSPNGTDVTMNKRLMFGCSSILSNGVDRVSGILGLGQPSYFFDFSTKSYWIFLLYRVGDKFLDKVECLLIAEPLQLICLILHSTLKEHISSRQAFHFVEENAILKFDAQNLFRQDETDYFCLSVQSTDSDWLSQKLPFSILGIWVQQFYYIAFDINMMRMSFTKIDCDILYD